MKERKEKLEEEERKKKKADFFRKVLEAKHRHARSRCAAGRVSVERNSLL